MPSGITVQAEGVIEIAEAFIAAYDASRTKTPDAAQESKELRVVARLLHTDMQAWMGALVTAAPQIDLSSFANASRTPKGIIANAQRLVEPVSKYVQSGQVIAFAEQMVAELQARIDTANKESADVLQLEAEHGQLTQGVRDLRGRPLARPPHDHPRRPRSGPPALQGPADSQAPRGRRRGARRG